MKLMLGSIFGLILAVSAWTQQSRYDPAPGQAPKQRSSFLDFALRQVNPANTDYGCQIDETQKALLDATIRTEVWWTAFAASIFFFLSFLVILHQHREAKRRVTIAAELMARYHNALVRAGSVARSAIERHDRVVDAVSDKVEGCSGLSAGDHATRAISRPAERNAIGREPSRNTNTSAGSGQTVETTAAVQIRALQQQMNQMQLEIDAGRRREDAGHQREKSLQRELDRLRRQLAQGPAGATTPRS